ncbi:MAG: twin-arginine translocase subunit TatC [Thermoleophilia bacterium]
MLSADDRLSLVEHLDELRKRLFRVAFVLLAGVIIAGVFNSMLFKLLLSPLPLRFRHLTTFSPAEPFMVSFKVWVYCGLLIASPFVIYQFWAFVGPAFSANEKKYFYPVVASTAALFLGGVVFCYLIVLPRGLSWLLTFNGPYFNVQNRAQEYFSFVAMFLLAFGAVFELPVVIVLAARLGIVDNKFLRKNRKYALLINAVIAAVATPSQDAFSMIAMFIPLIVLYEVSIWVARFVEPKRRARLSGAPAVTDGDGGGTATGTL